jgi:hypothetical protein
MKSYGASTGEFLFGFVKPASRIYCYGVGARLLTAGRKAHAELAVSFARVAAGRALRAQNKPTILTRNL